MTKIEGSDLDYW